MPWGDYPATTEGWLNELGQSQLRNRAVTIDLCREIGREDLARLIEQRTDVDYVDSEILNELLTSDPKALRKIEREVGKRYRRDRRAGKLPQRAPEEPLPKIPPMIPRAWESYTAFAITITAGVLLIMHAGRSPGWMIAWLMFAFYLSQAAHFRMTTDEPLDRSQIICWYIELALVIAGAVLVMFTGPAWWWFLWTAIVFIIATRISGHLYLKNGGWPG